MRSIALAFALTATLAVGATQLDGQEYRLGSEVAEAHHLTTGKLAAKKQLRPGCRRHYKAKRFYAYARGRFRHRSRPLTAGQNTHLRHLRLCLASKKHSRRAHHAANRMRAKFRARLARERAQAEYVRLTPYDCGSAGRFAIPCSIVACESGFSWSAYNPSGAAGPYQIMAEWGRPFPVRSWADKMAHHRLAARIWAGGAGRSNWVC